MHRRAWQATVHEVAKSQTRLSVTNAFTFTLRPDFKFNNGTKRKRPPHYFNLVNYCPSPHTMFFITSCLFISYTFSIFFWFSPHLLPFKSFYSVRGLVQTLQIFQAYVNAVSFLF